MGISLPVDEKRARQSDEATLRARSGDDFAPHMDRIAAPEFPIDGNGAKSLSM